MIFRLLTTVLIAGAACRPAPGVRTGISVVDDAGDTVRLAEPARRVVSLIPASTELLFALGADLRRSRTKLLRLSAAAKAVPIGRRYQAQHRNRGRQRPDLVFSTTRARTLPWRTARGSA